MSACAVARALRANEARAWARLLAVSGNAQPEDVKAATAAGLDRYVAKPRDPG